MDTSYQTLDDLVFENRNRQYGAYQLRKSYPDNLRKATFFGSLLTLIFVGSSFLFVKNKRSDELKVVDLTPTKIDHGINDKIPDLPPPPPPPVTETPPPVAQKAFMPPQPVDDALTITEVPPPNNQELDNVIIGTKNVEGVESTVTFAEPPPVVTETVETKVAALKTEDLPVTFVEQMPEFTGGQTAMYQWLGQHLKYPTAAVRSGVEGKVFVKFVVEKDGSISGIQLMKGIGFGCDEEAVRVIQEMPKWSPGRQNGKAVRVYFTIPIVFKLQ